MGKRSNLRLVRSKKPAPAEEAALAEANRRADVIRMAVVLAARDHSGDGEIHPAPKGLLDAFIGWLTTLDRLCPDSVENIAVALISGWTVLRSAGNSTSLLQLTRDVAVMLGEAEKAGGVPPMKSSAEPVALIVTMRLAGAG
jgi:hypothetical protein